MDAQQIQSVVTAIQRDRRVDYWLSVIVVLAGLGYFAYLQYAVLAQQAQAQLMLRQVLGSEGALAVQHLTSLSAQSAMAFAVVLLLPLIPWIFGRFSWRRDQALIALLRAQIKSQV